MFSFVTPMARQKMKTTVTARSSQRLCVVSLLLMMMIVSWVEATAFLPKSGIFLSSRGGVMESSTNAIVVTTGDPKDDEETSEVEEGEDEDEDDSCGDCDETVIVTNSCDDVTALGNDSSQEKENANLIEEDESIEAVVDLDQPGAEPITLDHSEPDCSVETEEEDDDDKSNNPETVQKPETDQSIDEVNDDSPSPIDETRSKPPLDMRSRLFQWWSPLDSGNAATAASRLIEQEFESGDEATRDDSKDIRDGPFASTNATDISAASALSETRPIPTDSHSDLTDAINSRGSLHHEDVQANILVDSSNEQSEVNHATAQEPGNSTDQIKAEYEPQSPYESSGVWRAFDSCLTLGLANQYSSLRLSRQLRATRKLAAKYTGLHGLLSGKKSNKPIPPNTENKANAEFDAIRRRLDAIARAKEKIANEEGRGRGLFSMLPNPQNDYGFAVRRSAKEEITERRRRERVKEIDRQFMEGQKRLFELVCEKDMLQRRPNPFWNYTTVDAPTPAGVSGNMTGTSIISATRRFSFPAPDLVDEYLEMMFLSSRLIKLNHTDLWKNSGDDQEDDDELPDDYVDYYRRRKNTSGNTNGNWLLRNGLGQKIGEAAEAAAYKSVCSALMSVLARGVSAIHGLNVMKYSDIRLSVEQAPEWPPLSAGMIPGGYRSNYAKKAIQEVIQRGAKRNRRKRYELRQLSPDEFVQREALVETLLSHCQISAPMLQLFPIAWQRALLGNIITLTTIVIGDFCEGLEFHILGHRLTLAFKPITEEDMFRGMTSDGFNRKKPDKEVFEATVRATAEELNQDFKFLDRWHERALGSDMLRSQLANLIARLVLTLTDDLLRGARMDLWATQAGGPRLVAGLEFRPDAR